MTLTMSLVEVSYQLSSSNGTALGRHWAGKVLGTIQHLLHSLDFHSFSLHDFSGTLKRSEKWQVARRRSGRGGGGGGGGGGRRRIIRRRRMEWWWKAIGGGWNNMGRRLIGSGWTLHCYNNEEDSFIFCWSSRENAPFYFNYFVVCYIFFFWFDLIVIPLLRRLMIPSGGGQSQSNWVLMIGILVARFFCHFFRFIF